MRETTLLEIDDLPLHAALKNMREKAKLTIREVEKSTGISRATICDYEMGRAIPKIDLLMRLFSAYGRTVRVTYGRRTSALRVVSLRELLPAG